MNPLFDYSIFTVDNPGFEILYEDGPVFVVNKPSGVLIQAPIGIDNLVSRVKHFFQIRDGKGDNQYLGVPHRLDRPASGAVVFAKHVRAAQRLSHQFEGRTIGKKYWAIVEGSFEPSIQREQIDTNYQFALQGEQEFFSSYSDTSVCPQGTKGTWEDFLRKIPEQPVGEICAADKSDARWAVLHYTVIGQKKRDISAENPSVRAGTLVEIELETGRFHQIRIQASSRHHAIFGDAMYGSTTAFGPQYDDIRERPIALHSRYLSFTHPMRDERIEVFAPLPEYWKSVPFPAPADRN